jgi:hypothetical protein
VWIVGQVPTGDLSFILGKNSRWGLAKRAVQTILKAVKIIFEKRGIRFDEGSAFSFALILVS